MNRTKKRIWKIARYCLNKIGIHTLLQKKGYEYIKLKPGHHYVPWEPGHHYVPDYYGRSAHKHFDIRDIGDFNRLATKVIEEGKTSHYYDRLFVIYQALSHLSKKTNLLNPINFAEIGVYKGGTSFFIASVAKALGINSFAMHCFDTFEGHKDEDILTDIDNQNFHKEKFFGDTSFENVSNYLREFDNVTLYKGRFQDTYTRINSEQFYFVHLDIDLYNPIIFALNFFKNRLIVGGIIIVDDYGFTTCPGAKKAVDEFIQNANQNFFFLHLLTGQMVLVKYQK